MFCQVKLITLHAKLCFCKALQNFVLYQLDINTQAKLFDKLRLSVHNCKLCKYNVVLQ